MEFRVGTGREVPAGGGATVKVQYTAEAPPCEVDEDDEDEDDDEAHIGEALPERAD